jgi:small-conductance mechanosensitive channel
MRHFHPFRLFFTFFAATIILTSLILGLWLVPATAQAPLKAPVVLDGQPIFQVSESGQFSAQERADLVNFQLKEAVRLDAPLQVTVERRNQLPALFLNDRYLLTVTDRDALPGSTEDEQAKLWARQIQAAVQQAQAQRSQQYLRSMSILSVVIILGAIASSWLLGRLRRFLSRATRQKLAGSDGVPLPQGLELLFTLLLAIARTFVWVAAALYIANLFPVSRSLSYQIQNILLSSFTAPLLTFGKTAYSITDLLILGGLLFGLVLLARIGTNLLRERVLSLAGLNRGTQEAIAIIAQYSLIFLGALVLLQVWGLDLSSLTILASALGIGLGVGLQNIAKNFGSGLILVFEQPIQVGDFIEVGDLNGTVERIGARSTEIRTLDQVSIIVPNSRFLDSEVINWSHRNPLSRLHLPVGVAYGSDPDRVRSALLEATGSHPRVLQFPPPQVLFKGFGDSTLDFELLVWTAEPDKQFLLKSDLYFRLHEVLCQRQIEIPFPQRDLHLRSGKLELSPQLELALIGLAERFSNGNSAEPDESVEKRRDDA